MYELISEFMTYVVIGWSIGVGMGVALSFEPKKTILFLVAVLMLCGLGILINIAGSPDSSISWVAFAGAGVGGFIGNAVGQYLARQVYPERVQRP